MNHIGADDPPFLLIRVLRSERARIDRKDGLRKNHTDPSFLGIRALRSGRARIEGEEGSRGANHPIRCILSIHVLMLSDLRLLNECSTIE